MSTTYHLHRTQLVPRPLDEVFAFFADAVNLEAITPEFLQFHILTARPIEIRAGALIDYRLKLFGIPFQWQTRIDEFVPGVRFIDSQTRGPYRRWHHTHEFQAVDGGTLVTDRVEYEMRLGMLGNIARNLFVARTLEQIFDHRQRRIAELLPAESAARAVS